MFIKPNESTQLNISEIMLLLQVYGNVFQSNGTHLVSDIKREEDIFRQIGRHDGKCLWSNQIIITNSLIYTREDARESNRLGSPQRGGEGDSEEERRERRLPVLCE